MPAGVTFTEIATGIAIPQTCALSTGGDVYCWTSVNVGSWTTTPSKIGNPDEPNLKFSTLAEGGACALDTTGDAYCWGRSDYGQLGNGSMSSLIQFFAVPVAMPAGVHFRQISSGLHHVCATTTTQQAVYCWGRNTYGQLGNGTTTDSNVPVAVTVPSTLGAPSWDAESIDLGVAYTCVTSVHGTYCWGANDVGQLGNGTNTDSSIPVLVQVPNAAGTTTPEIFGQITAGSVHTCAVAQSEWAFCWSRNAYGMLGDGTTTDSPLIPVRVVQPW